MKTKTKAKSISILMGIMMMAFVFLLAFVFVVPKMMSVYKYETSLTEPGSLPWWSGSCWDESSECKQLDRIVPFTNTIIVDTDWRITTSKVNRHSVFDYCREITEQEPSNTQTTYEYFFHIPHYRYTTYDRCVMDYKLESETIDENGCTTKTWTWYDGVLNKYHDKIDTWSTQKCWTKNVLSRPEYYWSNDNKESGLKSHTSGGSEYECIWDCYQTINIYYDNELLKSVSQPDSGGFVVDMDNMIVYDDYNADFVSDTKNFMRIRNVKSKYRGEPYYKCDYFLNEIIWEQRECLTDDECDDENPYTIYDKCVDYVCIVSNPVECVSDDDCEYFNECKQNACVIRQEYKDDDGDGVINKDDVCIDVYGEGDDGCPTITERIHNYICDLISIIKNMFGM